MQNGVRYPTFNSLSLDSLRSSAEARAGWPFLRELCIESMDRARALTDARTDLTGWLHVPEQVRAFALLVERLLRPGEQIRGISSLNFRAPLTTQARLVAERRSLGAAPNPLNAASLAEFETTEEEPISVLAVPDIERPLPPEFGTSGSYLAAPSIQGFKWGVSTQAVVPLPEVLLPFLNSSADIVDLTNVLMTTAAQRALFERPPALLLVVKARTVELPNAAVLVEGGSIRSSFDPAACRTTAKGFVTYDVSSDFFDRGGNKEGGAVFTFAMTQDRALAQSFNRPRL